MKHQSTTVTTEPDKHKRVETAKEFFGDGPPPDPAALSAATAAVGPVSFLGGAVETSPGVYNLPKHDTRDKCGGNMGRCFGAVVDGVCANCGANYTARPSAGFNLPANAFPR